MAYLLLQKNHIIQYVFIIKRVATVQSDRHCIIQDDNLHDDSGNELWMFKCKPEHTKFINMGTHNELIPVSDMLCKKRICNQKYVCSVIFSHGIHVINP